MKYHPLTFLPILFLSITFLIQLTLASTGDRLVVFQTCVERCVRVICNDPLSAPDLPLTLRFTFWDCDHDCKYDCMHQVTIALKEAGERVHQFYGKWPFERFLGMQEPASVVFSLFNGLAHYTASRSFLKRVSPAYPYTSLIRFHANLAILVWICSAIYHTRDFPITEKMDYFSAMASILLTCFVAFVKLRSASVAKLNSSPQVPRRSSSHPASSSSNNNTPYTRQHVFVALGLLVFYIYHISYLSFGKFDYGYNMKAGITVGVMSHLIWLTWVFQYSKTRPHAFRMVYVVVLISLAMGLEVFDFPPVWGVFDAHSLWHAASWPLAYLYWDILTKDAIYELKHVFHTRMIL